MSNKINWKICWILFIYGCSIIICFSLMLFSLILGLGIWLIGYFITRHLLYKWYKINYYGNIEK